MKIIWFIRLVRPVNLLIIAATMIAIRYLLIVPLLSSASPALSAAVEPVDFALLVLSTMLIGAGGYIINDYFDLRTDRINKPEKVIIGKYIKRRTAMAVHVVFNTLAFGIGIYLSIRYHSIWPALIHGLSTSLLWFYSLMLKRKYLSGNILIAFLAWLTPMLVILLEWDAHALSGTSAVPFSSCTTFLTKNWVVCTNGEALNALLLLVEVFAFFAFVTNLAREIIKDIADVEGDKAIGCTTLPIRSGINPSRWIVAGLLVLTMALIAAGAGFAFREAAPWIYVGCGVMVPLVLCLITLFRNTDRRTMLMAGNFLKIAMLSGLGTAFFIHQLFVSA
jgi:4-hydroxybenzoate polyprenyltransferase